MESINGRVEATMRDGEEKDDKQKDMLNEPQASDDHPVLDVEVEVHRTLDSDGADPGVR